jgi:hypothetical protein
MLCFTAKFEPGSSVLKMLALKMARVKMVQISQKQNNFKADYINYSA